MQNKQYHRHYYLKNSAKFINKTLQQKALIREYIKGVKTVAPCADCGVRYPYYVMDFDHLRDKRFNVSQAVTNGAGMDKLRAEIAKCEVVCANCHRERTASRKKPLTFS